ncbi:unnamed protein product [Oppiella nova]|uniref:Chitin-binding type-2 domain-containing protein n=1 Tax=Oppiella nova TaxID=334625 RepID=A0A7R9LIF2_9ACAR|nr:unnamed protein product [Oppiella nova]CAG2163987.1 unnamed protein product [Oppiella nova]
MKVRLYEGKGSAQQNAITGDCKEDGVFVFGEAGDLGYTECVNNVAEFHSCGISDETNHFIYDGERCVDPRFECPELEGVFRHNTSHRLYYKCHNRISTKHYCADNEVFDGLVCIRVVRAEVTSGGHLSVPFNCERDGQFANPESKTHYVICEEGEATVYRCPQVMVESDKERQWYEVFTRHKCVTPWECPEIDGTYKLSRNGRVHFKCVNGRPIEYNCAIGTSWDGQTCKVLYPPRPDPPRPDPPSFHCPHDGKFYDPNTRHGYIECYRNHPTHHACPGGFVFDGRTCSSQRHPIHHRTFICPNDGRFVDPQSGRGYFVCLGGLATYYTCSEGTMFDGNTCITDHPPFRCPSSNGLFANPRNQSEYYQCFYGRAHIRHCESGSIFLGDRCTRRGTHFPVPHTGVDYSQTVDRDYGSHHHHDDRFRILIRERDLVKFEFNNYVITDRFDTVAWKWNREIADKK